MLISQSTEVIFLYPPKVNSSLSLAIPMKTVWFCYWSQVPNPHLIHQRKTEAEIHRKEGHIYYIHGHFDTFYNYVS